MQDPNLNIPKMPQLPWGSLTKKDVILIESHIDLSIERDLYKKQRDALKRPVTIAIRVLFILCLIVMFCFAFRITMLIIVCSIFPSIFCGVAVGVEKHTNFFFFPFSYFIFVFLPKAIEPSITSLICRCKFPHYTFISKYDEKKREYFYYLEMQRKVCRQLQEIQDFSKKTEADYLESLRQRLLQIKGIAFKTEEEWRSLSDRQFEIEIGELYRKMGYNITVTRETSDGGVDVIIQKNAETKWIQCKHYSRSTRLGVVEMRAFYGVCAAHGVKGIMICTGWLTKDAYNFSRTVSSTIKVIQMSGLLKISQELGEENPPNSKLNFTDEFLRFIKENNFIDCNQLWLMGKLYSDGMEAQSKVRKMQKWKDSEYIIKDFSLAPGVKRYVILLVNQYVKEEIEKIKLN